MNICLYYDPELRVERVKSNYKEINSKYGIWKTYFYQCKKFVEESEKYLMNQFTEIMDDNVRGIYKTCAIEDDIETVILSTLDDILSTTNSIPL